MRWDRAKRTVRSLEDWKSCDEDEKRNEVDTQIGEYEMDQVILDLGSDVNVLPE